MFTPLYNRTYIDPEEFSQSSTSTSPVPPRRHDSLVPKPRPRLLSRPPLPTVLTLQSSTLVNDNEDSSDSDDPYLAFPMDLESLDISKLTIEQFERIDPRQAQLWMLLKMHQMVKKVEDVYESAEQLYSIYQVPPRVPVKAQEQDINTAEKTQSENQETQQKKANYENTQCTTKRPVPLPRKNIAKSQSSAECVVTTRGSASLNQGPAKPEQPESKQLQDTNQKTVKLYRKQKVIGELTLLGVTV